MNKRFIVYLWFVIFITAFPFPGQSVGDSLQMKLISAKHDTIRIELLNQTAFALRANNPGKALFYANIAMEMSLRNAFVKGLLNSFKIKGIVYKHSGDYEKSMEFSLKALKLAEISNDQSQISNCYNIIGSIYQAKSNYDMAISYFYKSFEIEMKMGDKEEASIRLYNIGTVYDMHNQKDAALKLYNQSLKIEEQLQRDEGIMYAQYGIGGILTDKGEFANAEIHLLKALDLAQKSSNISVISYCTYELGRLYMQTNRAGFAILNFTKSYAIADSIKDKSQLKDVCRELSTLYSKLGDYRKAFEFLSQYLELNESLNNSESNDKIAILTHRYEVEKKDRDYRLLLKENEIEKLELIQNKNFRNYFIFMSILIIIVLGISHSIKYKVINPTSKNESVSQWYAKTFRGKLNENLEKLFNSRYLWVALLTVYFLFFMLLFQPFGLVSMEWMEKGFVIPIYLSMLLLISLLVIFLESKMHRYFAEKNQVFRFLIVSVFISFVLTFMIWLYNGLQLDESLGFGLLSEVFFNVVIVAIFPITLSFLLSGRMIYKQYIEKISAFEENKGELGTSKSVFDEDFMLRIVTDNISETIVVQKSKLICVEANDNYSAVYFEKNGKIQKSLYRITLKRIETSLVDCEEFVRCHKSFIVNVNHLQKIVGNSQKYKMKVDLLDFDIPVSRNFPNEMLQSLRERADLR